MSMWTLPSTRSQAHLVPTPNPSHCAMQAARPFLRRRASSVSSAQVHCPIFYTHIQESSHMAIAATCRTCFLDSKVVDHSMRSHDETSSRRARGSSNLPIHCSSCAGSFRWLIVADTTSRRSSTTLQPSLARATSEPLRRVGFTWRSDTQGVMPGASSVEPAKQQGVMRVGRPQMLEPVLVSCPMDVLDVVMCTISRTT